MSLHIMAEVMPSFVWLNSEPVRRLETQSVLVLYVPSMRSFVSKHNEG